MKRILSLTRQAIQKYNMIDNNDIVAVGVSGGKDSLVLLSALNSLRNFYPKKFEIKAIIIDTGFENSDFSKIISYIKSLKIEYHIEHTQIKQIVFDEMKEKNPCSLCANLRRGALCKCAVKLGCTKLALGHNRDDANETLIMNLFYNSKIGCFEPVTQYENIKLCLIRPLIFVTESQTSSCSKKIALPVIEKLCPNDGASKREFIKEVLGSLSDTVPKIKQNIFSAICDLDTYKKYE